MRRKLTAFLAASVLAISTVTPSQAFIFGGIVYDPTNHTQNLLTAARTLQMINNQIKQLSHQAQMIVNQAENLKNLPLSVAADLQTTLAEIDALVASAKGIAFTVTQTDAAFSAILSAGLHDLHQRRNVDPCPGALGGGAFRHGRCAAHSGERSPRSRKQIPRRSIC